MQQQRCTPSGRPLHKGCCSVLPFTKSQVNCSLVLTVQWHMCQGHCTSLSGTAGLTVVHRQANQCTHTHIYKVSGRAIGNLFDKTTVRRQQDITTIKQALPSALRQAHLAFTALSPPPARLLHALSQCTALHWISRLTAATVVLASCFLPGNCHQSGRATRNQPVRCGGTCGQRLVSAVSCSLSPRQGCHMNHHRQCCKAEVDSSV